MSLHLWTSARYTFPLPVDHRFPLKKYEALRQRVIADGVIPSDRLHVSGRVSRDDLLRVHTADYVDAFTDGTLAEADLRRLGFPWSAALVERSYRSVGGTVEAAAAAVDHGVAMNLAGGTHHAFADHGEGFCVFNDVAVAIRALQHGGRIASAAIVDLDVHQGNGTNTIFAGDDSVLTFSMHGRRNYPFAKVAGSIDVELEDGTADDEYLERLERILPRVIADSRADVIFYLAGADAHANDRLGRLRLTQQGLARRDVIVLQSARDVGIPVVITIAGGYGRDLGITVAIHAETARLAAEFAGAGENGR